MSGGVPSPSKSLKGTIADDPAEALVLIATKIPEY
jgi:hypothetical protein